MAKIEAWQCTKCKQVHTTQAKQVACTARCTKQKNAEIKEKHQADKIMALRNYPRLNAISIPHLIQLCESAAKELWGVKLVMGLSVKPSDSVSNSSNAPIGKKTNWCAQDKTRPSSYPGLTGKIAFKVVDNKTKKSFSGFDGPFDKWHGLAGIGTTGGGSCSDELYDHNYGVELFLDDFPLIKKSVDLMNVKKQELVDYTAAINAVAIESINNDPRMAELKANHVAANEKIKAAQIDAMFILSTMNEYESITYRNFANAKIREATAKFKEWHDANMGKATS